jgi:hypothetical protein
MLYLYILLLGALAWLTAYTRNVQSTVIRLGEQIVLGNASLSPRGQGLRTMALVVAWPAALGLGVLFVAWWKAVALVVGAFVLLVPVAGSFTPRPMSRHYRDRIRSDLERRVDKGVGDVAALRKVLAQLDALSPKAPD